MDVQRPEMRRQKVRRRFVLGGLAIVATTGAAIALATLEPAAPAVERDALFIDAVQRGELIRRVRGPGSLVPRELRLIAAPVAGRVDRVVLKPGAHVDAETVLVEMSNAEVEQLATQAESALEQGRAELAARRVELDSLVLDQRARLAEVRANHQSAHLQSEAEAAAFEQQAISRLQYQRSRIVADQLAERVAIETERLANLRDAAAAQLAAEHARIEQLAKVVAQRRAELESLAIRAGMRGVLQALAVEQGQRVPAGASIARVAQPDDLIAQLRIAETQAKDIVIGQPVAVDTRNGIVSGRVARIDPRVDGGAVLVDVDLQGALPVGARPDLSVEGTVEIERLAGVLYVGRPAHGQPQSRVTLFRLDGDGVIARRVEVELGKASVNQIVIESGLQAGDRVILSDVASWDGYDRLRLR